MPVLGIALLILVSCTPGKPPFLVVEMCLSNEQGALQIVDEMKSIAAAENFDFVDNSRNTERELKVVDYAGTERTEGSRVINVGVLRKDGLGLGAGNLGLPGYQVAIGFSEGSNAAEAHDFADRVLARLRQRWQIEAVPSGSGAKPMLGCK